MTSLLRFLCVLVVIPATVYGSGIPGAPQETSVNDPEIIRLSEFVLTKLNEEAGDNKKKLIEVTKATVQVVAGSLTELTLKIHDSGEEKICLVKVWERLWLNKTEITDVQCDDVSKNRDRREVFNKNSHDLHIGLFNDFIKKHGKVYQDQAEYKRRYHIFRANLKKIKLLRETEQGTAKYGATWFSDLSTKEFKIFLGLKKPAVPEVWPTAEIPDIKLPSEFDWRHYNVVTPVKNQGACGSCWAFSVTGNVEGQWALKSGKLVSLSEQELLDCDSTDHGCSGGYMTDTYKSIVNIGGLETEYDYPYEASMDQCQFNSSEVVVKLKGGINITSNEEGMAKWLVKNGPMSVALNAAAMQFYMGGVSHPLKFLCNRNDLDHGVLIVGYGVHHTKFTNKDLPYWIVKNSWGKFWGEKGYYKVYRGDGTCGINLMVSSAVVSN